MPSPTVSLELNNVGLVTRGLLVWRPFQAKIERQQRKKVNGHGGLHLFMVQSRDRELESVAMAR
jgi:hypothetical protein